MHPLHGTYQDRGSVVIGIGIQNSKRLCQPLDNSRSSHCASQLNLTKHISRHDSQRWFVSDGVQIAAAATPDIVSTSHVERKTCRSEIHIQKYETIQTKGSLGVQYLTQYST